MLLEDPSEVGTKSRGRFGSPCVPAERTARSVCCSDIVRSSRVLDTPSHASHMPSLAPVETGGDPRFLPKGVLATRWGRCFDLSAPA